MGTSFHLSTYTAHSLQVEVVSFKVVCLKMPASNLPHDACMRPIMKPKIFPQTMNYSPFKKWYWRNGINNYGKQEMIVGYTTAKGMMTWYDQSPFFPPALLRSNLAGPLPHLHGSWVWLMAEVPRCMPWTTGLRDPPILLEAPMHIRRPVWSRARLGRSLNVQHHEPIMELGISHQKMIKLLWLASVEFASPS